MTRDLILDADGIELAATAGIPDDPKGVVLFAHGSGSSRFSPRNRFVASQLEDAHLATVLLDLLTDREAAEDEQSASLRFDIPFLAERLVAATDGLRRDLTFSALPLGYFGASTGAAAALWAAADRPDVVRAVVSRGGRPDLASLRLAEVAAPTLLIVGGADAGVLELNERAFETLRQHTEARLDIVSGATHLFEEPGALEVVARLASGWFVEHLRAEAAATAGSRSSVAPR